MVSEYMLQQTGAKQVEKKLPEFLKKFPTVRSLADASRSEVLREWQGLGYNRRALNLQNAARAVVERKRFPNTLEGLRKLPGIGRYTSSAIMAFSHNANVAVVDVNIERILSRMWTSSSEKISVDKIYDLDSAILPKGKSSDWHEALMDLGSTICTKRSPKCGECPVQNYCKSAYKIRASSVVESKEALYFGQPRRVWRGRILKVVVDAETISAKKIGALLQKQYEISETGFQELIHSILSILEQEGFITKQQGKYHLSHE